MHSDDPDELAEAVKCIAEHFTDEQWTPIVRWTLSCMEDPMRIHRTYQLEQQAANLLFGTGGDTDGLPGPWQRASVDLMNRNRREPKPPPEPKCSACNDTGKVPSMLGLLPDPWPCQECDGVETEERSVEPDDAPIKVGDYVEAVEVQGAREYEGLKGEVKEENSCFPGVWIVPLRGADGRVVNLWCHKVKRVPRPTETQPSAPTASDTFEVDDRVEVTYGGHGPGVVVATDQTTLPFKVGDAVRYNEIPCDEAQVLEFHGVVKAVDREGIAVVCGDGETITFTTGQLTPIPRSWVWKIEDAEDGVRHET